MVETHGFTQHEIAKLINKSKSYVCQILGLERLSDEARRKIQTSELSKEVQIQASRETAPERQVQILQMATDDKRTVRQIREKSRRPGENRPKQKNEMEGLNEEKDMATNIDEIKTFRHWTWRSEQGRFEVTILFFDKHPIEDRDKMVLGCIKKSHR